MTGPEHPTRGEGPPVWDDEIDEREACPRCHQINWGMTPDDRLECVTCGFVEAVAS